MMRLLSVLLLTFAAAQADTVLIEAESFSDPGGWVLDQQFIPEMGSPYLLAHGLGEPVADAKTTVAFPATGEYRVFVRTVDWVAKFGRTGAPGRFKVLLDGKQLGKTFGTEGAEWAWHDGGSVSVSKKEATVALHDLTGFEGRCDAILFTTEAGLTPPNEPKELAAFRRKALGLPDKPAEAGQFDLVVVGGGVAGTCAAVAAARLGLSVALIQDRPVLGGNSSSEVRVWIQGRTNLGPYPRLGEIVRELNPKPPRHCPDIKEALGDDTKLAVVKAEKSLSLFLNHHATKVETEGTGDAARGTRDVGRIKAIVATNTATGGELRFAGRLFADCTGDGTIGALAGADFEVTEKGHMGGSNMWRVVDAGKPSPFPSCPWAHDLSGKPFPAKLDQLGHWFWESGFDRDPLREVERARDNNFLGMYGAWDCLKNAKGLHPNHKLEWAAYIIGKRESRRLLGDVILTKDDVLGNKEFPDGCVPCTWSIDLHVPEPALGKYFQGDEFISVAKFTHFKGPYLLPYRCLYSRNVENLFMAGRDISVTHEALGTTRVMGTCGMMGEVVGRAAAIAKKRDSTPRAIYSKHLDELKQLMSTALSKVPLPAPAVSRPPKPAPPFNAPGPNLALAAKVTTSSDRDAKTYPPSAINDGKADTTTNAGRWVSATGVPNWVEFAWDAPVTIASARIISGYLASGEIDSPLADFALQTHDGKSWVDIPGASVKDNSSPYWFGAFAPVRASRLRLHITAAPGGISRLWEVELYAQQGGR
ncbi:MAG: FAD-dependent oxidoreductase [Planctomycetes bacterium]|nr:FAD-dependent oxidoreductase [Planctomycetota bacterium]